MKRKPWFLIGFLAPAVLLYAVFVVVPLGQTAWFSLYSWRGVSTHRKFVGAENYLRLFSEEAYHKALFNLGIFLLLALPVLLGVGVGVAHWISGGSVVAKASRRVYLLPHIMSLVVVAILWQFIFSPTFGLVNSGLSALHLESLTRPWLGDSQFALPAVAMAFLWSNLGFYVMLFSAGLQTIPGELHEAASLDGSVGWNRFLHITWPMLWSVKKVAVSYIVINVMNTFALVYLMTHGGPDRATEMPLTYLYERGFTDFRFGDASAVGMSNLVIALVLSGIAAFWFRKDPTGVRR